MSNPCDFIIHGKKMKMDEFLSYIKSMPHKELNDVLGGIPSFKNIPEAPFITETPSWVRLGLKTALKEAVRQGADRIAWTTGEQQNERYDLSKQVDEITYSYSPIDDVYRISVHKGGNVEGNYNLKENELEGMVGKEVAQKMINGESTKEYSTGLKSLSGIDLKVGGKGMKGFYGEPAENKLGIVGEVAKKLFGQEPKTVSLNTEKVTNIEGVRPFYQDGSLVESRNAKLSNQHFIEITPELKAEVEGGLPLFKDIKGRGKEIADAVRKGKIKIGGVQSNIAGIPIAIWNAAVETLATAIERGSDLAAAVREAIDKHKLNKLQGFNEKEFINKVEELTGEKIAGKMAPQAIEKAEPLRKKSLANRLVEAAKIPAEAKAGIEKEGLKYAPESQEMAEGLAKAIIDEVGIDEAVLQARAGEFGGAVNTLVQTEALNRLTEISETSTDPTEAYEAAQQFATVSLELDKWAREQAGRGISALNYFYKKSPLGMVLRENKVRENDFSDFAKPKDKSWQEFFDELKKEPEFDAIVKEQVKEGMKQERAASRAARKKKVDDFFDDAISKTKGGAAYNTIIPPQVVRVALEGMRKAYHAGEKVAELVQNAIDYISTELKGAAWDKEKFRKEWEQKLADKTGGKKPLTDEEIKLKILDKFRKKLTGLSNKQRDEVIRKAFRQLVDSGALEYEDFKKIIAQVIGRGELTPTEVKQLKDLTKISNAVEDAVKKATEDRTEASLDAYYKALIEAGKANRELSDLLYNKPDILKRLTSIMTLNTLGPVSLIVNVMYNLFNQAFVRFPIATFNTLLDGSLGLAAKTMGKEHDREYNTALNQIEFFKGLGLGAKESIVQLFTGLNRQDYIQKELYGQQIRPARAVRDLMASSERGRAMWKKVTGKELPARTLTKQQIWDKALQATIGIPAEAVARALNIGDKPQRFAAERAMAATFAKNLGLKDLDYKYFLAFPKEEAIRAYKAKGLSAAEAEKKAQYIADSIVKEGERSTFQQDNFLNKLLSEAFGSFTGKKDSGLSNFLKATTVSPFVKIPANAFWSGYNLVNPEVALLQSFIYAGKAASKKKSGKTAFPFDRDNSSAEKDMREARYWMAHAVTGVALRGLVIALVGNGIYNPANTGDETKKEREGEGAYVQNGTINVTKLKAWLRGEDPSKVKGGLLVQNKWFGVMGTIGNTIARKYYDMTPEQRANHDGFANTLFGGLEVDALKEFEQGVFSNTSSMLSALNGNQLDSRRWGVGVLNMLANTFHPAALAQTSKADLDYVASANADTFGKQLENSMLQRSSMLRNLLNKYPPAKVNIWGEPMLKDKSYANRLFGFTNANKDAFAMPIFEDAKRTGDIGYFPPAVPTILNDKKLTADQYTRLSTYVGQERKLLIAPYINDAAEIDGYNTKYSQLPDDKRKKVLERFYEIGRLNGLMKFYTDFPDLKPKDEEPDYLEQAQRSLFLELTELLKAKDW